MTLPAELDVIVVGPAFAISLVDELSFSEEGGVTFVIVTGPSCKILGLVVTAPSVDDGGGLAWP